MSVNARLADVQKLCSETSVSVDRHKSLFHGVEFHGFQRLHSVFFTEPFQDCIYVEPTAFSSRWESFGFSHHERFQFALVATAATGRGACFLNSIRNLVPRSFIGMTCPMIRSLCCRTPSNSHSKASRRHKHLKGLADKVITASRALTS